MTDDTDLEAIEHEIQTFSGDEVVRLKLTGTLSIAQRHRVDTLVAAGAAKARALRHEQADLRLRVSEEDLSVLQVDGYLSQVLSDLQDPATDLPDDIRQEALRLFADALSQRHRQRA